MERFVHLEVHSDLLQIDFVFSGGVGSAAHHVAEIVEGKPRHHRVQIDDAYPLSGKVVDQYVVGLGVVMSDPLRDVSGGVELYQGFALVPPRHKKINFPAYAFGPPPEIVSDRFFKVGEALGSVVEIRNRLVEAFAGQVHHVQLKFSEGLGYPESLFRCLQHIVGAGVLDKNIGTPEVAAAVADQSSAVRGVQQPQRAFFGFHMGRPDFAQDVFRDPADVVHYLCRFLEHLMVYALQGVVQTHPSLVVGDLVSVVHIPVAEGHGHQKISVDHELRDDIPEFTLRIFHKNSCRLL